MPSPLAALPLAAPALVAPVNPTLAKVGVALSAFGIFACGWLAMRTEDWRQVILFSVLALGAGAAATHFSRHAR